MSFTLGTFSQSQQILWSILQEKIQSLNIVLRYIDIGSRYIECSFSRISALCQLCFQQIKLQEIENYNNKHQDYLRRSGKQPNPETQKYIKPKRNNYVPSQVKERPIKQAQRDHFKEYDENLNKAQSVRNKQVDRNKIGQVKNSNNQFQYNEDSPIRSNKVNYDQQSQENPFNTKPRQYKPSSKSGHQYSQYPQANIPHRKDNSKPPIQQRVIKPNNQLSKKSNQFMSEFPQQQEEIILEECPEGCGRKFKPQVLQKHIKVCQKIFQGKRKPFKVEVVDDEAKNIASKKTQVGQKQTKSKTEKVPKWKKDSQLLRRGLKVNKQGGETQAEPIQQQDDRTQCPGCGRKFNQAAAEKHIPSCLKRNKQKR